VLDLKIEMLSLAAVRPYARNARKHSRRQIQKIVASIREYGFTNPIIVDESGEIITGHGRFEAAKALGLWQVPTIRLSNLSEVQKKALRLADNKIADDSEWSLEFLKLELGDLSVTDFDIALTGFDSIEVDKLITPTLDLGDQFDQVPEPPATNRRPKSEESLGNDETDATEENGMPATEADESDSTDPSQQVDRPGFDLGGSTGKTHAGRGLGLGTDAKEDGKGQRLPR